QRRHDLVAQAVQLRRSSLLGHYGKTGATGEGVNESVDCNERVRAMVSANSKCGTSRKIHMEKPAFYLSQGDASSRGAVDREEKFVSSRGRRTGGAKGCGNQAIGIAQPGQRDSKPDRV